MIIFKIFKNKMEWNGSLINDEIEEYDFYNIISGKTRYKVIYFKLNDINYMGYCWKFKNNFPIICEEIKKLLGIDQTGIIKIKIEKKIYIIYRIIIENKDIIIDTSLKDFKKKKIISKLNSEIKNIIIFKYLLMIYPFNKSNILIRKENNNYYPISFNELKSKIIDDSYYHKNNFSKSLSEYFNNNDLSNNLLEMLNYFRKNYTNINAVIDEENFRIVISEFKDKLDKIFLLESSLSWIISIIMENIQDIILF